jgi:hypothetical protein
MDLTEIGVLVRLCVGAIATFCAILLWARTRDLAWILVVTGVLLAYAGFIYDALTWLGLLPWEEEKVFGLSAGLLAHLALDNLPTLLYTAAFIVALARLRLR